MTPKAAARRRTPSPKRKPSPPKPSPPKGGSPIKHVVIIVKENHAFDNYFGRFPGANGVTLPQSPNPPPTDPDHTHEGWLVRDTKAVRQQFVETDIPAYWAYARQYTLCDNYFTDVAGPSTPNHLMLIAADSPIVDNPSHYRLPKTVKFALTSLPDQLQKAGRTWRNYNGYAFDFIKGLNGKKLAWQQFAKDAAAGKLADVSWVYADQTQSEHPRDPRDPPDPHIGNVTYGMQWTVDQVNAIVKGGLWPQVAIFITWDDWGGWWDHVTPPLVERVKDAVPSYSADMTQYRYGSRVGCLVLSPYAKPGFVSKTLHSHVSLVKFCETTFGLPSLNKRTTSTDGMTDCFDFSQAPLPPPK
jgi:phospholipase C